MQPFGDENHRKPVDVSLSATTSPVRYRGESAAVLRSDVFASKASHLLQLQRPVRQHRHAIHHVAGKRRESVFICRQISKRVRLKRSWVSEGSGSTGDAGCRLLHQCWANSPSLLCQNLEAEVGIGPFRRGFRVKITRLAELLKHYLA